MDRLTGEKEAALANLDSAETQLRGIKVKNLAQAKKVDELEAKLAITGAEIVEARAEFERTEAMTNKTIAVYLKDTKDAQMELREASNQEKRISYLAKYQSRRETVEEIYSRGFELTEEIAQGKALEADAKFLDSSNDDDDDEGIQSGSDDETGPKEEAAPEGETIHGLRVRLLDLFPDNLSNLSKSGCLDAPCDPRPQRLGSKISRGLHDITMFGAELSQHEAELKRSSDEGKSMRLHYNKEEEGLKDLRADLDKARQNEVELGEQVTLVLQEYGLVGPTVEANTSVYQQQQKLDMSRQKRKLIQVDIDSIHQLNDEEEDEGGESALVTRTKKPTEVVKSFEPKTLPAEEETLKKNVGKATESPKIEIIPSLSTSTPKGAIAKFIAEQSKFEAELKRSSDEGKAHRLFCSKKEEELKDIRADLAKARQNEAELDKQWKENMDRFAGEKEVVLANLSLTGTQLQEVKVKNVAQAKNIDELEAKLDATGAEVAEVMAQIKRTKATTDKIIVVYLKYGKDA
ncbi:uncharacterized protein [Nicotiana sylvestris]|uniref:uncharacterized protein n=1 Tax=Nicotiana sylvestris TaxID=4096 RepID=UPI00388CA12D